MTKDWIVKSVSIASRYASHVRVEIENLCYFETSPDRHATWTVPLSSIANERYDWTNAKYTTQLAQRLVCDELVKAGFAVPEKAESASALSEAEQEALISVADAARWLRTCMDDAGTIDKHRNSVGILDAALAAFDAAQTDRLDAEASEKVSK